VKQQLRPEHIEAYCRQIDDAGMYTVIIGHGNGIGASSILMIRSCMKELDMLRTARENLRRTKLGAFFTIGFATIEDDIMPAVDIGTEVFCIACHATEADTTERYIKHLESLGKEVYGVLMNAHMPSPGQLLEQCALMQEYGAEGVVLMDSAGSFTPEMVEETVSLLADRLRIKVGVHAHNNLSIAVANTYAAIRCGATIADGTVLGFGSGAGNCQLDALAALLMKEGIPIDIDLYKTLDAGRNVIEGAIGYGKGVDGASIIGGYAGVVSTFKTRVERISAEYRVDPRDVFVELGKRKVVAGQDDMILEAARHIAESKGGSR
jgi:4-hydroxy 2-oxovalerate aldolase